MDTGPAVQYAQCGGTIVAPEWSEHRSEYCVRDVWSCEACGYRFERTVNFSAPKIQPDLTIEENQSSGPLASDKKLATILVKLFPAKCRSQLLH
jgi:hypothetical protein